MAWKALFGAANATLGLLDRAGLGPGELEPGELMEEGRRRTGLDDFGGDEFREGLDRLVAGYEEDAALTPLGRVAVRTDLIRLLSNRLRLVADRTRHPGIAGEEIRAPVVIVSLPRTGTTLLHGLLGRDPANRVPRSWEVMYPSPPPDASRPDEDPRVAEVRGQFRWFQRMAPQYRVAHPIGAELPQECIAITTHAFESPRFHRTHHLPGYRSWLQERDRADAYRWHRRILQHLQWRTPGERWVLKNPPHTFWIETLHRTYPDARFVQTHRDPLTVMASFASHTHRLRRAFTRREDTVDADRLARRWAEGMEGLMAFRDRPDVDDDRFVDVHYGDLVRDPVEEVRRIYRRLDLPFPEDLADRMRGFLRDHPQDAHGVHRYTLEEWGLDPEEHGALFDSYRRRFGIEETHRELPRRTPGAARP